MLLGACFGSVIGIEVGNNEGTEIGLLYWKVPGSNFEAMDIFYLGTCDVTGLGSTDGAAYGKLEGLFQGD